MFGVSQPRVNNLLKGRIDKFTIDTLVNWLGRLDRRVDVVVNAG
jgi:predicted XRE-type DNA-binding protein